MPYNLVRTESGAARHSTLAHDTETPFTGVRYAGSVSGFSHAIESIHIRSGRHGRCCEHLSTQQVWSVASPFLPSGRSWYFYFFLYLIFYSKPRWPTIKMTSGTVSLFVLFLSCSSVFAETQQVQFNQVLNVNGDVSSSFLPQTLRTKSSI